VDKGTDQSGNKVLIDTVMSGFEVDLAATGISMNNLQGDVKVYPNPVKKGREVIIETSSNISKTEATLKNVAGKTILIQTLIFENGRSTFSTKNTKQGIYFLTLNLKRSPITIKLVVVE
jgi:hypothetical protein